MKSGKTCKDSKMKAEVRLTNYGEIPAEWRVQQLREVCFSNIGVQTGPFGSQLHQRDYQPVGTPILTVEHLGENRIIHQDIPRVSEHDRQRLSKYMIKRGDIIFSRVGSVDLRALVREEEDGWLFSGRCLRVRPNQDVVSSEYLSWFFGLPAFKEHIRRIAVGATMPSINTDILSGIQIILPPLSEQRAIARILCALDDKIELNRRMNRTLEAMTQAIFKSWFVDFDPVVARSEGRQPFGMNAEMATLFPQQFADSELGVVPKGWWIGTIEDAFDLTMGQSPPGKTYNKTEDGIAFYQGRTDFGTRFPTPRVYCTAPTRFANSGDTLVSVRAPVGDINMALEKCSIGRGLASIRHKSNSRSYTYYAMNFLREDFDVFEGEGTLFGSISGASFRNIKIVIPSPDLISKFEYHASPLDQEIENNERQNVTLSNIRDVLLPKLLSGEIRVRQAEKIAENLL